MAVIKPFRAIRPVPEMVDKVAALPYDVMSSAEAREMVKDNPYSFLHVDKAEIDLDPAIDLYDERVYAKARENLDRMITERVFIQDEQPCFYIYRQKMGERYQTGLVAGASIDDYLHNRIRKHELTRADKELDRTRHVDICDAQTGPIFLTYRAREDIDQISLRVMEGAPVYDYCSEDGIGHTVWVISDASLIRDLESIFAEIPVLYIADGHHRSASAVKVGQMRRESLGSYSGDEEFNYFMAVIFPDQDLFIMDYNRVVRDLNGLSEEEFLKAISRYFRVEPLSGKGPFQPRRKHQFGMYMEGRWYELNALDSSYDPGDAVKSLDVSILQELVLGPLLAIDDPRTSSRIDFVGGIRGLQELERRVDGGMKVAFSMYPTGIDDLMAVADAGQIMPPKSTWFEPKLRSGIFIHRLD